MAALIHDKENDYTLAENEKSCWITVDGLSIYIVRDKERKSVFVEVYEEYKEFDDPIETIEVSTKRDAKKEE